MKKLIVTFLTITIVHSLTYAQSIVFTKDLFNTINSSVSSGEMTINQDVRIDTLISRHIEANRLASGIDGFRIQVFRKGGQTAREEAEKVMAKVVEDFPDIKAYRDFEPPNIWVVRLGDFRTKIEATKAYATIRKTFPDSYIIRQRVSYTDIIF